MAFKKTALAFQRRKNHRKRSSSRRARVAPAGAFFAGLSRGRASSSEEETDRAALFGDAPQRGATGAAGDGTTRGASGAPLSGKTASAVADLEGLKQGFAERGEKLSKLTDKAEELNDASEEFEKMCARLNRQANRGWFG